MKRKSFILIAIVMIILLISSILINHDIAHSQTKNKIIHQSKKQIDSMIQSTINYNVPGIAVLIIKNNKIFLNKGYGYANLEQKLKVTPRTNFEIASMTKAFTGYSILQLAKEGKLGLNDKVSKFIPGFYMRYDGKKKEITIKQLLGQTNGIPSDITEENHYSKDYSNIEKL